MFTTTCSFIFFLTSDKINNFSDNALFNKTSFIPINNKNACSNFLNVSITGVQAIIEPRELALCHLA